ncbi:S8 family serine peptidase [Streptomyces puniciscabiei]|uniref:S53 family peptidase n=1 Tax=Streptomyces puniciscabiei TaxID=164348 RepID=UPI00378E27C2
MLAAVFVLVGLAAASATAQPQGSPAGHRPAAVQAHGSAAGRPKPLPPMRVCQPTSNWQRAACLAMMNPNFKPIASLSPGQMPPGLSPFDIRSAYKLAGTNGRGRTVAINVAFHNPNLESDLAVYRRQFHLRPCTKANGCLRVINQNGGTTPPSGTDPTWAFESSIDVDAVSAACPDCHILVVETDDNFFTNLFAGVDQAVAQGAKFINNSWVLPEASFESNFDFHFSNNPGVAFTFGSGDNPGVTQYPAASPYVTAVGGTTLARAHNRRGWTESAWNSTGCGCSLFEPKPPFQHDSLCPNNRAIADVSAVADNFAVYDTTPFNGSTGWFVANGTSISSPLMAGMYALAGNPAPGTFPNSYPYAHPQDFFDITTGAADGFAAVPGYDAPTGIGTPNGVAGLRDPAGGGYGNG